MLALIGQRYCLLAMPLKGYPGERVAWRLIVR